MQVEQLFTASRLRNFNYLVYDPGGQLVVAIDPFDATQISDRLQALGLTLTHIINTHEHHDHVAGNQDLLEGFPSVQVCVHPRALAKVPGATRVLSDGDTSLKSADGTVRLRVLDTPGHTFAHISLVLEQGGQPRALFSGDTLFNAGVGNCYRGGDPEVLFETVQELTAELGDDVLLYPGHDYLQNNLQFTLAYEKSNAAARDLLAQIEKDYQPGSRVHSLGQERAINTFLRLESPDLQARLLQEFAREHPGRSSRDFFLKLRQLRDNW